MHGVFLQDLAVVMIVSGLVTLTFHMVKQPVVLGYLLAGVLIGPHALPAPLITDEANIHTLAELGVVFLLFALGLEFNLRKLSQIGFTTFIVAPLETGVMFLAGYQLGQVFGWSPKDSIYLGGIMMISSTTIITKTLADLNRTKAKFAEVIFGILIAEDIIAILLIASLSGVDMTGGAFDLMSILATIGRLAIFLVGAVVVGLLVVPRLIGFVARFKNDETLLVTVLGLCFGLALLAVKLDYSVALGAFIIGALLAESSEIHKIEHLTAPLRDMFSAVFFVAIGLLIDPKLILEYIVPVTIITIALVVGKILACSLGCFVAGHDRVTALRVGLGLAQIGEFSFIIAALGKDLGVISDFLYPIAVSVSAITTTLTPFLIKNADWVIRFHDRFAPRLILDYQRDYHAWIGQLRERYQGNAPRKMINKMLWQIGINVALIAGMFILAVFVNGLDIAWLNDLPRWTGGKKTLLWLGALLLSLPIFIAALRKLQAFSMLLSEMTVPRGSSLKGKTALRAMVSNTTLLMGIGVIGLLVLLLSSALLPSGNVLIVLVILAVIIAIVMKTFFTRIYSRAQVSIRETLSRPRAARPTTPPKPMPDLLEEAELLTLTLSPTSPAAGRQIAELAVRSNTGATIVVIRREHQNNPNPDPGEILRPGDQILLLGTTQQLGAARKLLE